MKWVVLQVFVVPHQKTNEGFPIAPPFVSEPREALFCLGGQKRDLDDVTRVKAFNIS
jgi:hypothetical protein